VTERGKITAEKERMIYGSGMAVLTADQNTGKRSQRIMSTQDRTRLDEIKEQVKRFDSEHPEMWKLFIRFTFDRIRRGHKHYSVNAIFERIRWEVDSVGGKDQATFKLNNNYRAIYSRRFHQEHPEYDGFFRTRTQTSVYEDATRKAELGPVDYDPYFY
jgi:hypothetical protein